MSLAGSPALPDSSSPADMTMGLMPSFLKARLHCEEAQCRGYEQACTGLPCQMHCCSSQHAQTADSCVPNEN